MNNLTNLNYNISSTASGGDFISRHPYKDEIIRKATDRLIQCNKDPKNILRNKQNIGSKNPNFGKRWNNELKEKVSKIVKERWKNLSEEKKKDFANKSSLLSKKFWNSPKGLERRKLKSEKILGINNPFYGKNIVVNLLNL